MPDYPPEPWDLRGRLHASAFLVPLGEVPLDLPRGYQPVRIGRRGVVGLAWVDYTEDGVLAYREVMATVLVCRRWRVLPTVVTIRVDSVASRDGGRALWAIPKELASFKFDSRPQVETFEVWDDSGAIASGTFRRRARLPRRWPVRFAVVQNRSGTALVSPVRVRAALELSSASLTADPSGPLAFLAGRRSVASFTLRDFTMSFGVSHNGRR